MQASHPDETETTSPDAAPRAGAEAALPAASPRRIPLTLVLVLLALAMMAKLLGSLGGRTVDGAALQQEYFGAVPPPFGLTLAEAVALPSGEVVVRFARTGDGREPSAATLVKYPSRGAVEGLFATGFAPDVGRRVQEWQLDPKEAWNAVVRRGPLEWGEWSTKWIVERAFHAGGGWHEEARVDLGTPGRALVLFVHWPDEIPADEKHVLSLAGSIHLPAPGAGS